MKNEVDLQRNKIQIGKNAKTQDKNLKTLLKIQKINFDFDKILVLKITKKII